MTVISIPQQDKDEYCLRYTLKLNTIEDLMDDSGRSRRTIVRMLEEQGITVPMHRRNRKSKAKAILAAPASQEALLGDESPPSWEIRPNTFYNEEGTLQPAFFVFKNEPEPESKALFMGLINRVKRVFAAVMA